MQTVCGKDMMRRQKDSNTMLRNMGRCILRLHVQNVRQFFLKLTNLRNKIAEFQCDQCRKTYRVEYQLNNHMKTDHPEPDLDVLSAPSVENHLEVHSLSRPTFLPLIKDLLHFLLLNLVTSSFKNLKPDFQTQIFDSGGCRIQ